MKKVFSEGWGGWTSPSKSGASIGGGSANLENGFAGDGFPGAIDAGDGIPGAIDAEHECLASRFAGDGGSVL